MAALVMMICVATTISVVARERVQGAGHQGSTHHIQSWFIHRELFPILYGMRNFPSCLWTVISCRGVGGLGDEVVLGPLKRIFTGGQHQGVAVGDVFQGLYRGALVDNPCIVQQQH